MGFGSKSNLGKIGFGLNKVSGSVWGKRLGTNTCEDCGHSIYSHNYFVRDDEAIRKQCGLNGCPCQ